MDIRIAGLANDSIVDGPGIRMTVYAQGCSHACPGCQNPQTQDPFGGDLSTTDEILSKAEANPLLKGVTLSGGEPFDQAEACLVIARGCHEMGLDVWAYTGYLYEEIVSGSLGEAARELLEECDVVVDGPFEQDLRTLDLRFRGSSNQRIIDVAASLDAGTAVELDLDR